MRNCKAVNLLNLASLTMHRLVRSDNVSGSFEKMLVDADTRVYEQMKLLYVTKKSAVVEAIIESSFVR